MPLPPAPGRRAAKLSPEAFLPVRGAQHADPLPADDLPDAAEAVAAAAPRKRKQATAPASNNTATAAKPNRKSTRLNSSHLVISYAVFCLKKKKNIHPCMC